MLDFTNVPIVDAHGHPFMPTRERKMYENSFSMSVYPSEENYKYLMSYKMAVQRLKKYFGMPEDTEDSEVIAHRQKLANEDYISYAKNLIKDSKVVGLISDYGFPITGNRLTDEELQTFYDATDGVMKVYDLIRIETACDRFIYRDGMSFDEMLDEFDKYVAKHIKERRTVGIKSVIGYYTGLKWEPTTYEEAKKSFETDYIHRYNPTRADKKFRDYMVYYGLEIAAKYGLNFQMHTGVGDPPQCDVRLMNANDLYDLINTETARKVNFILCHSSFPYSYEAAILAANYPNVYIDVSSTVTLLGRAEEEMFKNVFDVCPHNKIMYGSDSGGLVDQSWFAAIYFKAMLKEILEDYVAHDAFTEKYAQEVGEMILHKNAERIYGL